MSSGQSLRVLGELLGQHLNSHLTAQVGVLGTVDLSHTPFAYFFKNLVMANGLTDHEVSPRCRGVLDVTLGGGKGQSKLASIVGGVGWNGVEWVWRGYTFGYKMPILALSGETGFP